MNRKPRRRRAGLLLIAALQNEQADGFSSANEAPLCEPKRFFQFPSVNSRDRLRNGEPHAPCEPLPVHYCSVGAAAEPGT